jgi:flagellar hook-length control protein FliK
MKRAELLSGLTQPSQNTAQAIASSAMLASTPATTQNMPTSTAQPAIATPLGSNGWADEFSQKISWLSTQHNHVAELRLNPPNLGPLDVVLKVSDNQATALFTSPHGAVRDAVENALPKLRELLADNGIMLGNATVSDQSLRDRNMDGFRNPDSGTAAQHDATGLASGSADLPAIEQQTAMARRHNGMVDTFA